MYLNDKMRIRVILTFFFLHSFIFPNKTLQVDLITTNDLHGSISEQMAYFMNPQFPPTIIGGAGFYKYINDNIDKNNSIILDGGNFFQGHPISDVDSGKTVIEYMNKIGYTALVPGSDDFIYGSKNLNTLAENSEFPFLISNIQCNGCDLTSNTFQQYLIKEINGIKFGFLGFVDSDIESKVLSKHIKNLKINGIKESLDYWIPIIDSLSDVVIILTSSGVPYDREDVYNDFIKDIKKDTDYTLNNYENLNAVQMGYFSNGVDLIVSGGVSKGYRIPWKDPNTAVDIFQNYGNGTSFGHVILNIENNAYQGYEFAVKNNLSQTLLLDDFKPDINLRSWIKDKEEVALKKLYKNFEADSIFKNPIHSSLNSNINIEDNWLFPVLGSDDKFDIITWNCEFFPTSDQETIDALSEAIIDFDVEVIAFQEIKQLGWFGKLMDKLPDYNYIISENSSFMNQAVIYKNNEFRLKESYEPFSDNDYNFAGRPPLRVDLYRYSDSTYYSIVNLHMKCCDSGLERRKRASQMLYDYLSKDMENGYFNFIVLGDWNDDLKDDFGEHCFDPFLNDNRFYFVTEEIVNDLSQASYPKEPYYSFLDHILVTNEILNSKNSVFEIKTIKMGDFMGGYDVYEKLISDHLPVLLSF